jgi:hypothetical protein
MKSFYSSASQTPRGLLASAPVSADPSRAEIVTHISTRARIAVYDAASASPHVVDIDPQPIDAFIETLTAKIHELSRREGGGIPYAVIREVTENLIHAEFLEPVVSILEAGSTIRFADQGPGFPDKERVLLPGFTTARGEMKRFIRGVGSGLPIVRDYLVHSGGYLAIEDNLGACAVVTIHAGDRHRSPSPVSLRPASAHRSAIESGSPQSVQTSLETDENRPSVRPRLSARQQQVLALVLETGLAGPSLVSRELGVGISTAYRDLATLEDVGLIASESGKRTLTPQGLSFLGDLLNDHD